MRVLTAGPGGPGSPTLPGCPGSPEGPLMPSGPGLPCKGQQKTRSHSVTQVVCRSFYTGKHVLSLKTFYLSLTHTRTLMHAHMHTDKYHVKWR